MEPLIKVRNLRKDYATGAERIAILQGVDLDVFPGEMVSIMGPSGMGKSTFLFILGLLLSPSSGSYKVVGREVADLTRSQQAQFRRTFAGFVFQSCNLFEHTTVYENLEFPLLYAGVPKRHRKGMIELALERVNLTHRIHHPANRLSGGEQQRVSIARSLVNKPKIIFADEPTGQLDLKHSDLVMTYFRDFVSDSQTAMVVVTHDPDVAQQCTRRLMLRDGNLLET